LLPARTLESFKQKAPTEQFLNFGKIPYRVLLKELFSNYMGRIFQVKGQSKKVA